MIRKRPLFILLLLSAVLLSSYSQEQKRVPITTMSVPL